jgi:cytochrome b subunit of formate dehydrogenase
MKNLLARFRQAGSFIAGLLIGISIMIPMFAMMVTNLGGWEMHWILGAVIVLALGLKLQFAIIEPDRPRTLVPAPGALPVTLMELKLE